MNSDTHPYCKDCIHSMKGGVGWCYMFRDGDHVDQQRYCGQFSRTESINVFHPRKPSHKKEVKSPLPQTQKESD